VSWGNWKRPLHARTQGRKQWKITAALLVPDVTASNGCGQNNRARVKDCQLMLTVVGHLNWMRNYSVLRRCGYTYIFLHVGFPERLWYYSRQFVLLHHGAENRVNTQDRPLSLPVK
jgi:hypothetical protein